MRGSNDADRWRRCAETHRTRAHGLMEPEAQRRSLATAETYDWLADVLEKRTEHRRSVWTSRHEARSGGAKSLT